jgi:mono/diheme cytochrome c family protein
LINKGSLQLTLLCLSALIATTLPLHAAEPSGRELFSRCAACHLPDAQGAPGAFPPLAARLGPLVSTPVGRDYLVLVLQYGLMGQLQIDGSSYQGVMPAQGPELGSSGVAAVLNFLLQEFNSSTLPARWQRYSTAEVTRIPAHYPNWTAPQTLQLRADVFPVH